MDNDANRSVFLGVSTQRQIGLLEGRLLLEVGQEVNQPADMVALRDIVDRPFRVGRPRRQRKMRGLITRQRRAELRHVAYATRPPRRLARRLNGGQQHPNQDADNGNHHQKFNEGEGGMFATMHDMAPWAISISQGGLRPPLSIRHCFRRRTLLVNLVFSRFVAA